MTETLALIPARGGSKGIPRKNIRNFAGYPLIAWSIAAAKQSASVTRVIVSTDDEEIAAVARQFGAETPFLRPAEHAQDATTDLPVFVHALKWLAENENYKPDIVVQLRPTSPIRPRGLVDDAVKILLDHPDADSVRGVVSAGQNPHKMWRLPQGGNGPMQNLLDVEGIAEPYNAPRQILPPVYWQTGHIDAMRAATILNGSMSGKNIYPLVIDPAYTVDIDNLQDWARYEHLVSTGGLDMLWPGRARRSMPKHVQLIVTDFDGVITDNRVWTDENGKETVVASRSDSMRIRELRERGIEVMILSSEPNPVVKARARKMGIEAIHGIDIRGKGEALKNLLAEKKIAAANVVYIGNDLNDLPCFEIAGWTVAVADAYPEVLQAADHVLAKPGGHGAVRELCEMVLKNMDNR
ncbi:MAG: 3-deoxy-manno-octulosonate cytidylyltransferase [Anaerolineales bacterium]|nr:3-deoxy-manno-octulosonate cytidylyltransferase [Anaerolineales bacterium]